MRWIVWALSQSVVSLFAVSLFVWPATGYAASAEQVQGRMSADAASGAPLVAHVIVALCDVDSQGVVPPPDTTMCDTDKPGRNLYWGALYGVRTHLKRSGWQKVDAEGDLAAGVVDRVVYKTTIKRGGKDVTAYVVAEAHDGRKIRSAIQSFLAYSSGYQAGTLKLKGVDLPVGGAAHVVAFVGHNGLMDFDKPQPAKTKKDDRARSSVVLACASKSYFQDTLTGQPGSWLPGPVVARVVRSIDLLPGRCRFRSTGAAGRSGPGSCRYPWSPGR